LAGRASLVADDAAEFAACLDRLIDDRGARVALGDEGHRFAQAHLSPEACYGALVREIHRPKVVAPGG
jgi:hypothetical protein